MSSPNNNESSNVLDIEKKALFSLQNCKVCYKNYKKAYMTYFQFVDSGVKTIELIGNDMNDINKKKINIIVNKTKTLSSFMNSIEIKFDRFYNSFLELDRNSISPSILKKIDTIYENMNDAKESFKKEINKILVFDNFSKHSQDLDI